MRLSLQGVSGDGHVKANKGIPQAEARQSAAHYVPPGCQWAAGWGWSATPSSCHILPLLHVSSDSSRTSRDTAWKSRIQEIKRSPEGDVVDVDVQSKDGDSTQRHKASESQQGSWKSQHKSQGNWCDPSRWFNQQNTHKPQQRPQAEVQHIICLWRQSEMKQPWCRGWAEEEICGYVHVFTVIKGIHCDEGKCSSQIKWCLYSGAGSSSFLFFFSMQNWMGWLVHGPTLTSSGHNHKAQYSTSKCVIKVHCHMLEPPVLSDEDRCTAPHQQHALGPDCVAAYWPSTTSLPIQTAYKFLKGQLRSAS